MLWSWRTRDDGSILVRIAQVGNEGIAVRSVRLRSPHALGVLLLSGILAVAGDDPVDLACEHVHVGKNAKTSIEQAYWLGQVMGPVSDGLRIKVRFARPTEWRKAVGVNPRLKGKAVKAEAAKVLAATCPGLADLVEAVHRKTVLAHDFEAGGVARWAMTGSSSSKTG